MYNIDSPLIYVQNTRVVPKYCTYIRDCQRSYICIIQQKLQTCSRRARRSVNNLSRSVFAHGALPPPPTAANFIRRQYIEQSLCRVLSGGAIYGSAVNLASLYQIIITLKVKTEPRRHNMIIQDKCYDFNLICFVQAIAGRPSTLVFGGYTFYL